MSELLSQDELDNLLSAIDPAFFGAPGKKATPSFTKKSTVDTRKVRIYDFKRPDKFTRERIRTIACLHESLAKRFAALLSRETGADVNAHVACVDQMTFEEVVRSIPTPSSIATLRVGRGEFVVEVDPPVSFATIDAATGGSRTDTDYHELTRVERGIMAHVFGLFASATNDSWKDKLDAEVTVEDIETTPALLRTAEPSSMVALVSLEVTVGEIEGVVNVCYPSETLDAHPSLFGSAAAANAKPPGPVDLNDVPVDVVAAMTFEKTVRDVTSIRVGTTWKLPYPALYVGAKRASPCVVGKSGSVLAVKLGSYRKFEETL